MAGDSTNISIRMDAELKAQADALFNELGMNLSTAFNIFVRQSLREGGIPFAIKLERPNSETAAAMLEAELLIPEGELGLTAGEDYWISYGYSRITKVYRVDITYIDCSRNESG